MIQRSNPGRSGAATLGRAVALGVLTLVACVGTAEAQGGQFAPTGSLVYQRSGHTATLLDDGKVLVVGGIWGRIYYPSILPELYDPATGTFTAFGTDPVQRLLHTATLLRNGKVLVAGGLAYDNMGMRTTATALLYDPATRTFTPTGSLLAPRAFHEATLLSDGRVLITGGNDWSSGDPYASTEIYDPATGTFSASTSLTVGRRRHVAVPLAKNKVLVAGGEVLANGMYMAIASAEVLDLSNGRVAILAMNFQRSGLTATTLRDGTVLLAGGGVANGEIFDPSVAPAGGFHTTGPMSANRALHSAVRLPSGKVLVAGGQAFGGWYTWPIQTAELFDPATGTFTALPNMAEARAAFTAVLLQNGKVLVAGGTPFPDLATASAELFIEAPYGAKGALLDRLQELIALVEGLRDDQLKNRNNRGALTNKLVEVIRLVEQGDLAAATAKMQHDVGAKMDGVAAGGAPDANDWLAAGAHASAYPLVVEILALLRALGA